MKVSRRAAHWAALAATRNRRALFARAFAYADHDRHDPDIASWATRLGLQP
jgi:hypothetical protein